MHINKHMCNMLQALYNIELEAYYAKKRPYTEARHSVYIILYTMSSLCIWSPFYHFNSSGDNHCIKSFLAVKDVGP